MHLRYEHHQVTQAELPCTDDRLVDSHRLMGLIYDLLCFVTAVSNILTCASCFVFFVACLGTPMDLYSWLCELHTIIHIFASSLAIDIASRLCTRLVIAGHLCLSGGHRVLLLAWCTSTVILYVLKGGCISTRLCILASTYGVLLSTYTLLNVVRFYSSPTKDSTAGMNAGNKNTGLELPSGFCVRGLLLITWACLQPWLLLTNSGKLRLLENTFVAGFFFPRLHKHLCCFL